MISLSSCLPQIGPEPGMFGLGLPHAAGELALHEAREQAAAAARAACEEEHTIRLLELARSHADEMQAARKLWIEEESATLASYARQTIETTAYELASAVEQILEPFLGQLLPQAAVAELVTKVRVAAVGDLAQSIWLTGPQDLVAATSGRLAESGYKVGIKSKQQSELAAQIGDTHIVSNLGHWLNSLGGENHG